MNYAEDQPPEGGSDSERLNIVVGSGDFLRKYTLLMQTVQVITDSLRMYLSSEIEIPSSPATDGGVVASLAALHLQACERLADYLGDKNLWKVSHQLELYDKLLANEDLRADALKAQASALKAAASPSVLLRPSPILLPSGQVLVYYGPEDEPENWIIGIGTSLEEAMNDFDARYKSGKTLAQVLPPDALQRVASPKSAKPVKKPKTKRSTSNEAST